MPLAAGHPPFNVSVPVSTIIRCHAGHLRLRLSLSGRQVSRAEQLVHTCVYHNRDDAALLERRAAAIFTRASGWFVIAQMARNGRSFPARGGMAERRVRAGETSRADRVHRRMQRVEAGACVKSCTTRTDRLVAFCQHIVKAILT
jgi:hypothetical protein